MQDAALLLRKPSLDYLSLEECTLCCWRSPRGPPSGSWCVWMRWDQTAGPRSAHRPPSARTWAERTQQIRDARKKNQHTKAAPTIPTSTWLRSKRDCCTLTLICCGNINGKTSQHLYMSCKNIDVFIFCKKNPMHFPQKTLHCAGTCHMSPQTHLTQTGHMAWPGLAAGFTSHVCCLLIQA